LKKQIPYFVFLMSLFSVLSVRADEGMWTPDVFPAQAVKDTYGIDLSTEWLEKTRLSALNLQGCSASFVSDNGLVMTNHHCVHKCLEKLSSADGNLVATGFQANSATPEIKCPGMGAKQLLEITDVTARINTTIQGLSGLAYATARTNEKEKIIKECAIQPGLECEIVTLYSGGKFDLYKYKRYSDVRLVFAPEVSIASFGGDPDNFNFPRFNLDLAFVRAYENNQPAKPVNYLRWAKAPLKDGDFTFVAGHPRSTSRLNSLTELTFQRDVRVPYTTEYETTLRDELMKFSALGDEQSRVAETNLYYTLNNIKVTNGKAKALHDPQLMAQKTAREEALKARVHSDPALEKLYGGAWQDISDAYAAYRRIYFELVTLEYNLDWNSRLFGYARKLGRFAIESVKPNADRLSEYKESALPDIRQGLGEELPVNKAYETMLLTNGLILMKRFLGPNHPAVVAIFGDRSAQDVARDLVITTKLDTSATRTGLFDGGSAAITAANDPLIQFAQLVDQFALPARREYENVVRPAIQKSTAKLAQAAYAVNGKNGYPDATGTLRFSYGKVKGWQEGDHFVPPFTDIGGAFNHATGRDPFVLPDSWRRSKAAFDLVTHFNLVTTNDVIGGFSGSPLINRDGEVAGLVFDGNIHSLGSTYWFEPIQNRSVAVDVSAIMEALTKVYHADNLIREISAAAAH
jgi:hypothetical protein